MSLSSSASNTHRLRRHATNSQIHRRTLKNSERKIQRYELTARIRAVHFYSFLSFHLHCLSERKRERERERETETEREREGERPHVIIAASLKSYLLVFSKRDGWKGKSRFFKPVVTYYESGLQLIRFLLFTKLSVRGVFLSAHRICNLFLNQTTVQKR